MRINNTLVNTSAIVPIASYCCICSGFGSSRSSGSGYADASGTYGHFNEESGRNGLGSSRGSSSGPTGAGEVTGSSSTGTRGCAFCDVWDVAAHELAGLYKQRAECHFRSGGKPLWVL